MRAFLALSICLVASLAAVGQKSPKQLSEQFLTDLPKGPEKALAALYYYNPDFSDLNAAQYEEMQVEVIKQAKSQGEPRGHEFIREQKGGQSLVKLTYLAKFQKAPAVATFLWYEVDGNWLILDLKFDSRPFALQKLFDN